MWSPQAEQKMLEANYNKEYLPIEGLAEFRKATIDLMLGSNSKASQEVIVSDHTSIFVSSIKGFAELLPGHHRP